MVESKETLLVLGGETFLGFVAKEIAKSAMPAIFGLMPDFATISARGKSTIAGKMTVLVAPLTIPTLVGFVAILVAVLAMILQNAFLSRVTNLLASVASRESALGRDMSMLFAPGAFGFERMTKFVALGAFLLGLANPVSVTCLLASLANDDGAFLDRVAGLLAINAGVDLGRHPSIESWVGVN